MNWKNSNFQILYFMVGQCKTPDEAYRILCQMREDRELALGESKAGMVETKIRTLNAEKKLKSKDEIKRLEGEAELLKIETHKNCVERCIKAAEQELSFINKLIDDIQPLRKYKNFSDEEAHQLCQREEWKLKLIERAQAMFVSMGTIPYDHLITMMNHPDFNTEIYPTITKMTGLKEAPKINVENNVIKLLEDKTEDYEKWPLSQKTNLVDQQTENKLQ